MKYFVRRVNCINRRSEMTVKKEKPVLNTQNIEKLESILSTMKYGSVTIYMQDKKIVQIEKTEKYRMV